MSRPNVLQIKINDGVTICMFPSETKDDGSYKEPVIQIVSHPSGAAETKVSLKLSTLDKINGIVNAKKDMVELFFKE